MDLPGAPTVHRKLCYNHANDFRRARHLHFEDCAHRQDHCADNVGIEGKNLQAEAVRCGSDYSEPNQNQAGAAHI